MPADGWDELVPGTAVTVLKLRPDGTEAARYPGEIVATWQPNAWVVVRATWTYNNQVDMDGLSLVPGDNLLEWFSPELPFNAFAVFSPTDELRGWYANVTKPAYVLPPEADADDAVLIWRDLYVDLVGLPDGRYTIRDLDELYASSLARDDPRLVKSILAASNELRRRFTSHLPPFISPHRLVTTHGTAMNSSSGE